MRLLLKSKATLEAKQIIALILTILERLCFLTKQKQKKYCSWKNREWRIIRNELQKAQYRQFYE